MAVTRILPLESRQSTKKAVPCERLSTLKIPPWASTIRWLTDRPKPEPVVWW